MKVNIVMLAAGAGIRFKREGFNVPKPLIKLHNKPFLYYSTLSLTSCLDVAELVFVVQQEHIDKHQIDQIIYSYYPEAKIVVLKSILPGALFSAQAGVKILANEHPVIINDCDHYFIAEKLGDFIENNSQVEGILMHFLSSKPNCSYAKYNDKNLLIETKEKEVISNYAIAGAYYFANKTIFLKYSQKHIDNNSHDEYYISRIYNDIIANDLAVIPFHLKKHFSFGTPEEFSQIIENFPNDL